MTLVVGKQYNRNITPFTPLGFKRGKTAVRSWIKRNESIKTFITELKELLILPY